MPRIAVVQRAPAFLDRGATLELAVAAVDEAARAGARLIVFPEAFIPGYPVWIWRLRPGTDMALTEQLHARLRANAVSLAGDDLAPLYRAARRNKVCVVCGINERDAQFSGGTLYNTVVVIGPDGALHDAFGILHAEIDLERVGMARRSLDVVGHYARPDIFRLQVNRRAQGQVIFEGHDNFAESHETLE